MLLFSCGVIYGSTDSMCGTEFGVTQTDSVQPQKTSFVKKVFKGISSFINEFNTFDTTYIEPQHYKFQAMGQLTSRFERYTLKTKDNKEIVLSPEVSTTFGPYVGYSLIFLGYTLQFNNLYLGNYKKTFNISLYSALGGVDFYYRNNNEYKIKKLTVDDNSTGEKYDTSPLINSDFDGLQVKYWGFNAYYIFNHRKHSYPAAYNQSTCQKRSAGSPHLGFGYGRYNMTMDWGKLNEQTKVYIPQSNISFTDSDSTYNNFRYNCYSVYGGYSYNWVFAKNWLLGASASAAVSYNHSSGDVIYFNKLNEAFSISNFSLDGIGRMGIVWNNTRFFAGATGIIHSYSYSREHFSINNLFGSFNVYFGINFGRKKEYRKPGRFFEF